MEKGVGVVLRQAQSHGFVADEAAYPLHYPIKDFSLPHIVQKLGWYDSVKCSSLVQRKQHGNLVLILPICMDLLQQEIEYSVYGPATAGPHVLGREKAVLLRQKKSDGL